MWNTIRLSKASKFVSHFGSYNLGTRKHVGKIISMFLFFSFLAACSAALVNNIIGAVESSAVDRCILLPFDPSRCVTDVSAFEGLSFNLS